MLCLIALRQALISYQDYHVLLLVLADVSLRFHGGERSGVYELLQGGRLEQAHLHHPASWNPAMNEGIGPMQLAWPCCRVAHPAAGRGAPAHAGHAPEPEGGRGRRHYSSAYASWLGQEPSFTTKTRQ